MTAAGRGAIDANGAPPASDHDVVRLFSGGNFLECPRWHDGRWWVSDMEGDTVWSVTGDGRAREELRVSGVPGGLGFLPDGSLLAVSREDRVVLRRRPDGSVQVHADVGMLPPGRLNDMVVDRAGRAYIGLLRPFEVPGEDRPPVQLAMVDVDGTVSAVGTPLHVPNGMVITPDGSHLIVAETLGNRFTEFEIGSDGLLDEGRAWAAFPAPEPGGDRFPNLAFVPDGCCFDEGTMWFADLKSRQVVHMAAGGKVLGWLALPEPYMPFACALGGEDGRTLLISASLAMPGPDLPPGRSVLLTCRVDPLVGG